MNRFTRRAFGRSITITVLVVAVIAVVGYFGLRGSASEDNGNGTPDLFEVRRGGFDITIPASGELAAEKQIEIASKLEERAVITYIVDEGTWVEEGTLLVSLNDETISNRLKDAEDTVNNAEASWIAARADLNISRQSNASEIAEADLRIHLAQLALEAWEDGTDVSTRDKLKLDVETAQKDYDRLVDYYQRSVVLQEQGFLSLDDLRQHEISMIRAGSSLAQAKSAKRVYEDYEAEQSRAKLTSDVSQARDERSRIEQKHSSGIQRLETNLQSKEFQYLSQKERLDKYRMQVEACTIHAPQAGLVVYYSSLRGGGMRGGDEPPPMIGTELRRNEPVIVLPDTSKMIAEVKVNEALSGKINAGQRAVIISDAVPDTAIPGEVENVGVLAESGGWRDPNRRDYTVRIKLNNGQDLGLKPAMRCRAQIYVGRVEDALFIPVTAVFRKGPTAYVHIPDGGGYAERPITMGRSSDLYIEVLGGLEENDSVLTRKPAATRITDAIEEGSNGHPPRNGAPTGGPGTAGMTGAGGERPASATGTPGGGEGQRRGPRRRPEGAGTGGQHGGAGQRPSGGSESSPSGHGATPSGSEGSASEGDATPSGSEATPSGGGGGGG